MVGSGVQWGHAGMGETAGGEASGTYRTGVWASPGGLGIMGTGVPEATGVDKVFRESVEKRT